MLRGSGLPFLLLVVAPTATPAPLEAQLAHDLVLPARTEASGSGATVASAILPGAGQFWQGRKRWVAFLALEAVAVGYHLDARADGHRFRRAYRDLAWEQARGAPVPRVDADFDYYERLTHWTRSGQYDADPGAPGVQPERDPTSYNGAQWELAAELYLDGNPDALPGTMGYTDALRFYEERAYDDTLVWDWSGIPEEQVRFARLIERSDARFQRAGVALTVVIANHLLSAVDAFVAGRSGRPMPLTLRLHPGLRPGHPPTLVATIPLFRNDP